jgi:hypothetical protein
MGLRLHRMASDEGKDGKDPFVKFSKESLGFGSRFKAGKGSDFDRRGLKGAVRELRDSENPEGKNLSKQDVERFSSLLAAQLKAKDEGSSGLDRAERAKLQSQVHEMHRSGKISSSDVEDFNHIIDKLSAS